MSRSPTPSAIPTTPSRTPSYNFQVIFGAALNAYKKQTKQDLATHPLSAQLQACNSPSAILNILHEQVDQFNRSRSGDERLNKWLNPTVNVLYAFSEVLGEGIGLVLSPAKLVFAGVGVLLLAAKDVDASQDALVDIFEHIEYFFRRLETFTEVPQTPAMTDVTVKIMVEVLDILAIATKEIKQSRAKKYLRKLAGQTDIEDKVKRLDRLTNEQARMANAQLLKVTHGVDDKLTEVGDGVKGVQGEVRVVGEKVKMVDDKLQGIIDASHATITSFEPSRCQGGKSDGNGSGTSSENGRRHRRREAFVISPVFANGWVSNTTAGDLLLRWQSPPDPSTNHNLACDYRHEGSAEWFFQDRAFEEWIATGSLLWIHGKPGSGKSIISSAIIENIKTLCDGGLASMAYFYFDFRDIDKQARRNLLSSLLIQLSDRSNSRCDILSRLYTAHGNGAHHPNDSVLMQCLTEMLTLPDQAPTYIILDALDECPSTSGIPSARKQVLDLVKDLVGFRLPNLHICVTSRPEVDIEAALAQLAFRQVSLHDESGQIADIANYIKSIVYSESDTAMGRWRSADKDLVIETLSEKADGM
ncbi:hypothetical protein EDB83DRAFT_2313709 [Lactarius deliciosus]|nr:hypothetical protein EDB83DRAFT_2313709 [Lactarius deliciosus]